VFKERYFKLVGNLLFCTRLEGGEVLSLLVLETCSVQKEDKVISVPDLKLIISDPDPLIENQEFRIWIQILL